MGYNSTVIVLNDALGDISRDPQFGQRLKKAILEISIRPGPIDVSAISPSGNIYVNAASVIESHHADSMHLIAIGGNTGYDFGRLGGWKADEEIMFKTWAARLGFEVRKKD